MKKVLTGLVAAVVLITAAASNLIYTTAADGDKTGDIGKSQVSIVSLKLID